MPRCWLSIILLFVGCGAEEFGLRPPSFAQERNTAIFAYFTSAAAEEPEQILAFDLRRGPVQFGFQSESITANGQVVALAYDETLEELGILEGAVTRPQMPVQCALTRPAEIVWAVLEEAVWTDLAESPRVLQFITGNMACGGPSDCMNLDFTRFTPLDRDTKIEVVHPLKTDEVLVLGENNDVLVASPGTVTSTGFPDFYRNLPNEGSTRAQTGESYFFGRRSVVRVNAAFTDIDYREAFAEYRVFGAAPSPDGQRLLAFTSTHKGGGPPPYSIRIWLRENESWSILYEDHAIPALVPTTSPIAWRNNSEAYVAHRANDGDQGLLYRFRDGAVLPILDVPNPAGVAIGAQQEVYVGSANGTVYLLNEADGFDLIGGNLINSFHAIANIDGGTLVGGFAGRFQEVYADGRQCPVKSIASGIVNRIQKNGDGFVASGVLPPFILWTD